jgi:hypothetical protein
VHCTACSVCVFVHAPNCPHLRQGEGGGERARNLEWCGGVLNHTHKVTLLPHLSNALKIKQWLNKGVLPLANGTSPVCAFAHVHCLILTGALYFCASKGIRHLTYCA